MTGTSDTKSSGTITLVLHPVTRSRNANASASQSGGQRLQPRSPKTALEEACGLARAIMLDVKVSLSVPLAKLLPGTLFGKGKVEELGQVIKAQDIELVIINASLTPIQQRNLERAWNTKVLDRTALILEIFGERAQTREGQLQVDLAHLTYQRSRLVRSWTHLERQRGGVGFIGGPGETQIESDRRVISEKITKLKRQLETVKRTRQLHRKSRAQVPYPIVALVGYTNAGKSTLFNQFTGADVLAKDILFATLDPTMRAITLPSGHPIILSDTVGFISDLPTQLIAAFRATLEEVLEADLIIHVRDVSDPDTDYQREDVLDILRELMDDGGEGAQPRAHAFLEVQNKIDLIPEENRITNSDCTGNTPYLLSDELSPKGPKPPVISISALKDQGLDKLLQCIDHILSHTHRRIEVCLPAGQGGEQLAWCYRHGKIIDRSETDNGDVHLLMSLSPSDYGRFERLFGKAVKAAT